jgi:hypothetical protein
MSIKQGYLNIVLVFVTFTNTGLKILSKLLLVLSADLVRFLTTSKSKP